MSRNAEEMIYDFDVRNLEEDGFYVPYENFDEGIADIIKSLLMDAVLGLLTGIKSIPQNELEKLKKIVEEEPDLHRPIWPVNAKTSLEMAGFMNSYCLRYPDMTDTLRMVNAKNEHGGHPSDMMAVILTMCDIQGVSGKRILECVNVGYQIWNILMNAMLTDRNLDCSTGLSFVTPIIAALSKGDPPERIQNALNLSVANGIMLGRVRSTDDMTNLKSAAAGYAIAKSLWSYRMSDVIEAPATIFTGDRGSWYKVVAPLDRPFKGICQTDLYQMIEIKSFPCFNVAQAPVECGVSIHKRLNGDVSKITRIVLKKSAKEAKVPFRTDRPKYPYDHPTADHHMEYCVSIGLCYGQLTPKHYEDQYIQNAAIRHLIDVTELELLTEEELEELGGNIGACTLEVWLEDGTSLRETRGHASGNLIGTSSKECAKKMREIVESKREMVELCYGYNLGKVAEVVYDFEKCDAMALVNVLKEAIGN